jgi:hypothetical protein
MTDPHCPDLAKGNVKWPVGLVEIEDVLGQAEGGGVALFLAYLDQERGPPGVPGGHRGRPRAGEDVQDRATGRAGVPDQEL